LGRGSRSTSAPDRACATTDDGVMERTTPALTPRNPIFEVDPRVLPSPQHPIILFLLPRRVIPDVLRPRLHRDLQQTSVSTTGVMILKNQRCRPLHPATRGSRGSSGSKRSVDQLTARTSEWSVVLHIAMTGKSSLLGPGPFPCPDRKPTKCVIVGWIHGSIALNRLFSTDTSPARRSLARCNRDHERFAAAHVL
jgi:hypothetical protein